MSVNKAILIGRLGRDPEVRHMPNGEAVCNFSIATDETWKDQSGQRQTKTEWHAITLYRRLAEVAGQYLKKGSQVYIEGRIQSRKYTGKDGIERTAYDIVANEMKMLDGRNSGSSPYEGSDQYAAAPSSPRQQSAQSYNEPAYAAEPPAPPRRQAVAPATAPIDDIDDDIPF